MQQTFHISRFGTIAGCRVLAGSVQRDCACRVIRDEPGHRRLPVDTLRREKDDAKEVREGYECGMKLNGLQRHQGRRPPGLLRSQARQAHARLTTRPGGRHRRPGTEAPGNPATMYIGVLQFSMAIPHAESLKDKRRVVRGLKDRLRRNYNVSIAEIDDLDIWNVATLGVVMVSNDVRYLNGALDKIIDDLEVWRDATLEDHQIEIVHPS